MANDKDQKDEMNEAMEEFSSQAAGHLKNTTHTLSELLDAMSSKVRADVADLRKELMSNPLVDKELTSLIKNNRQAALEYIKTLVDQGKLSKKAAEQLSDSLGDMTEELKRSYDVFEKGTKAVRENIRAKKDELDAYKEGVKGTKEWTAVHGKQNDLLEKVKKNEEILNEKRAIYQKYIQKEIPDQEKLIQQLKEQNKQKEALGELTDKEIYQLKVEEGKLQELLKSRNEEVLAIREIQAANQKRIQSAKDNEKDLADIELNYYREVKQASIDAEKQSSKFSTNMKAHMHDALISGEGVIGGMKKGFDSLAGIQRQRGVAQLGMSLRDFTSKKKSVIEEAEKKKALSTGDPSAKLTSGERFAASLKGGVKGLPEMMKGVMGGLGKMLQGVLSKAMSGVMGGVMSKLASIASAIGGLFTKIGDMMGFTKIFRAVEIMVETIGELFGSMMNNAAKFQRELGMSSVHAAKLASNLTSAADFSVLGPDALAQMEDSFAAMVEYSGTYLQNMENTVFVVAELSRMTGISAEESAMFVKHMQDGLGKSGQAVEKMVMGLRVDAQMAGLNFKAVMSDVAKQGSRMALYGEQIATGIMKAAVRAKQLGGDIKGWVSMTDEFADSFASASDTAMSFNRIIGREALSGYDLFSKGIQGDTEGIMNSFTDAFKGMDDATFKLVTTGRMGQLAAKSMKMGMDEFQKYVERVDIERMMTGKFQGAQRGFADMFGAGAGDQIKTLYAQWQEGITKSNKDVSQELIKMQEEAAAQAALEYKRQGYDPNEFFEGLRKGEEKFVNLWQSQMQKQLGYQSFDDMKDALEKAMTPEERIEGMIKELVKGFMPKVLKLLSVIAKGIGNLVMLAPGGAGTKIGAQIMKTAGIFDVMSGTLEVSNTQKELKKLMESKDGDLKKLSEEYGVALTQITDLNNKGERDLLNTQLNELLKRTKTTGEKDAVIKALESLSGVEEAIKLKDSGTNLAGASEKDVVRGVEIKNERAKKTTAAGVKMLSSSGMTSPAGVAGIATAAQGVLDFFTGSPDIEAATNERRDQQRGATKAKDIAFGKGRVKYVVDANKNVFELDPDDMVVASTNFDFGRDRVETGKPLEKGRLSVKTEFATSGKQGGISKTGRDQWSPEFVQIMNGKSVKISEALIQQMSSDVGDSPPDLKVSGKDVDPQTLAKWNNLPSKDPQTILRSGMPGDELVWDKQSGSFRKGNVPKVFYPPSSYNSPQTIRNILNLPMSSKDIAFSEISKGDLSNKLSGLGVSDGMLPIWRPIISKIESIMKMWGFPAQNGGMFKIRENRNNGLVYSNHSFATAKDFNTKDNPNERSGGVAITSMPPSMLWAMYSALGDKFSWGGRYKSMSDAMHFELNKVSDFASENIKHLVDSDGNAYQLGGERVMISPNLKLSSFLGGMTESPLVSGGIYQSIPMPSNWKDNISKLGVQPPDNIEMDFFRKLLGLSKSPMKKETSDGIVGMTSQALRDIGYSEDEIKGIGSSPHDLFKRLYDELFQYWDESVSYDKSRVDWKKFIDGQIGGVAGLANVGGTSPSTKENKIIDLISGNEGSYGTLVPNDKGLPSYGKFQWRGGAFKKILQEYLKKGALANELSKYKTQIDEWKNPVGLAEDVAFKELMKRISQDPVMKDIQDRTAMEGSHITAAKKAFESLGLKTLASFYTLADTKINGGMEAVLEKFGAGAYPKNDELAWSMNYLNKRLERYKTLDGWDEYGSGWTKRVDKIKKQIPPLAQEQIADAYFSDGDVKGILTDSGFYAPKKSDAVAVGTGLPNLQTNTDLSQGELATYLNGNRAGGAQNQQTSTSNMELVSLFKEFMRKMTQRNIQPASNNTMSVTIDGEPIGRVVGKNLSGHGRNLNGG